MRRWNYVMLSLCLAAGAACADRDRTDTANRPNETPAVGTSGAAAEPGLAPVDANRAGMMDRDFVRDMMADGAKEIELGRLAQQKSKNPQVREFGAMMVRDHQKAAAELKDVAEHANVTARDRDAGKEAHHDLRDRLAKLSGAEFDREYINAMVDDHQKAVDDVKDKADGADNDHVKSWAAKTLPTLQKHLDQAKQIQQSLDKRPRT